MRFISARRKIFYDSAGVLLYRLNVKPVKLHCGLSLAKIF